MKKLIASLVCGLTLFAGIVFPALIVPDVYDKLFVQMNGTTTSFVDSSTANPKTITANGNATQLPIKFNKSAGFFNGTTDYLDIANSTDFAFGTGAFTIEGFFNTGIDATAQTILDTRAATANTTGLLVNIINSTGNKLCVTTATTARITGTTTLAKNTWYHFMVVGNGGANGARTIILYLDGVQEGSTYTNDYNFTDQTLRIGAIKAAAGTYMNGWMKELRISNVARTVAVPTAQYKSDANTVLLMHFDTPATSPLAPAISFDGTGDYLDFSDSADFAPGTGAFTVEGFLNTGVPATAQTVYDTRTATANTTGFLINIASSKLCFTTATTARITGGTTLIANRTYHWRVVGNGGADGARTVTLYLNGQVEGTAYTNNYNFTDQTLRIGSIKAAAGTAFNGWMREIRVSNNERNTTAFTPSQAGFTVDANTKLYIKGNEDNGVTTFLDSSTSPKTVTTNGDTKIKYTEDYRSCIFKDEAGKFPYPVGSAKVDFFAIGSGVGYFDKNGDYLESADSADWDMQDNPFTLEAYARYSAVGAAAQVIIMRAGAQYSYFFAIGSDEKAQFMSRSGGSLRWNFSGTTILLPNTWYHLAATSTGSGGAQNLWVNGFSEGTPGNYSSALSDTTDVLRIGADNSGAQQFGGLLDNIRISKGVARYTATFNPPEDYESTTAASRRKKLFWFFNPF